MVCPVDDNHRSRGIFCAMGQKGTKVLTCGGVVGADEPLQVGSSSRKRSRGLTDGSKWWSSSQIAGGAHGKQKLIWLLPLSNFSSRKMILARYLGQKNKINLLD